MIRSRALLACVALACTASPRSAPPGYVSTVESAALPATTPVSAPSDWLLAHVDVETTGLVPGFHEMIDLGMALTDLDGNVIDTLFIRIMPDHPDRVSEGARRVNAFDAARWRELGALAPAAAVDSLVSFHTRVAGTRSALLVAYNSQFDAAFLDHLFRARDATWRQLYHYFVLDIPSMAWALGYRELSNAAIAARLGVADEPRVAEEHTGMTGAMLNVRIYQALRRLSATPAS